MSPTGRRAWRRAAKKLRRKMGRKWHCSNDDRGHIRGAWFKRHGFQSLDQESSSRHYIGLSGTVDGDTIGFVEAARSFTARSLVGMSMGARKRIAWREYLAWCRKNPDRELLKSATIDTWDEKGLEEGYQRGLQAQREVRTKHRIGERLRPCPGCCSVRYRRYKCGKCGVRGVRLWRPYGNFYRPSDNLCTECAPPLTQEGRPPWYVPLVIGPRGQIWGFGARSQKDMAMWDMLPVSLGACQICDGSGVLPARKAIARAR